MKNNTRMIRINDEIQKELAEIIRSKLKDPRIPLMTSVLSVNTTNDLKISKIYISVLGNEKEKADAIDALKSSAGFIRREIARNINLRNTPEFQFYLDDSIEYSSKISKIIKEVNSNQGGV